MLVLCVIAAVVAAALVAWAFFGIFFNDIYDYLEAWKFSFTPDLWSLIKGNWWDDREAEFKLSLYHLLVVGSGIVVFIVLRRRLGV